MTHAERTHTIKYFVRTYLLIVDECCTDEGTRYTGMQEEKKRKVRSKAQKQECRTQGVSIATKMFPSLIQSQDGDLVTSSTIFFLLSSATVSSVTAVQKKEEKRKNITKRSLGDDHIRNQKSTEQRAQAKAHVHIFIADVSYGLLYPYTAAAQTVHDITT